MLSKWLTITLTLYRPTLWAQFKFHRPMKCTAGLTVSWVNIYCKLLQMGWEILQTESVANKAWASYIEWYLIKLVFNFMLKELIISHYLARIAAYLNSLIPHCPHCPVAFRTRHSSSHENPTWCHRVHTQLAVECLQSAVLRPHVITAYSRACHMTVTWSHMTVTWESHDSHMESHGVTWQSLQHIRRHRYNIPPHYLQGSPGPPVVPVFELFLVAEGSLLLRCLAS